MTGKTGSCGPQVHSSKARSTTRRLLRSGLSSFLERTPAVDITLVRNDRYYKGPPLLDRVVFHVGADAASFLRGEVTYAEVFPDEVARVRGFVGKSAQLVQVPRPLVYTFLGWNEVSTRAPWARRQTRPSGSLVRARRRGAPSRIPRRGDPRVCAHSELVMGVRRRRPERL